MRIDIMTRQLPSGKTQTILVNATTRRYIGQLGPNDTAYNAEHIQEAVNMYQDLEDLGLLKKVMAVIEQHKQTR